MSRSRATRPLIGIRFARSDTDAGSPPLLRASSPFPASRLSSSSSPSKTLAHPLPAQSLRPFPPTFLPQERPRPSESTHPPEHRPAESRFPQSSARLDSRRCPVNSGSLWHLSLPLSLRLPSQTAPLRPAPDLPW